MNVPAAAILVSLFLALAPASARSGEADALAALKCRIVNDRLRLLDMIQKSKSGLEIDVELEKHRQRLSALATGQSQPIVVAAARAYYASSQMIYKARHGNPFVIQQQVEIALSALISQAADMPDCSFSRDVRDLIDRQAPD